MAIEFKEKVGDGAYGDVWLAYDTELKRRVAAKIIRPSDAFRKQTLAHAQALTQLDHPTIVKVFSIETVDDPESPGVSVEAILMEFVDGPTLAKLLANNKVGIEETRRIGASIIDAVEHMKERKMPHGDLHEGNIMATDDRVVVIDVAYLSGALSTKSLEARVASDRRSLQHLIEEMLERCDDSASRITAFRDNVKRDPSYAGLRNALNASLMKSVNAADSVRPPTPTLSKRISVDTDWFQENFANAHFAMDKLGLGGRFELRFAVDQSLDHPLDVLRAAVTQTVSSKTGGQLRLMRLDRAVPHAAADGIVAEAGVDSPQLGASQYDYWALKTNGDFFLLQRLAEDYQFDHKLWFDATIVRAAASLRFASSLYSRLGVKTDATLMIRTTYRGLKGRILASGSGTVQLFSDYPADVNEWASEIRVSLNRSGGSLVDEVKTLVAPMLMRFNFAALNDATYASVIERYVGP